MRLVMLGPQGAGKGTQGKLLADKLGIPHISTGDLFRKLREEDTPLGKRVKDIIDAGNLVDDELLLYILRERIEEDDCDKGFVLDGTPRTKRQAEAIEDLGIDAAIYVTLSEKESLARIGARMHCPSCGRPYNDRIPSLTPMVKGKCDACGTELVRRHDDTPKAIKKRLATYHEQTEPIIKFYEKKKELIRVNGDQSIEDVFTELWKKLQKHHP